MLLIQDYIDVERRVARLLVLFQCRRPSLAHIGLLLSLLSREIASKGAENLMFSIDTHSRRPSPYLLGEMAKEA